MNIRKPIVAANWKLNMSSAETVDFLTPFLGRVEHSCPVDIVVAPPFTSLPAAAESLSDSVIVKLAAQNMSEHASGAYTGEVSATMLKTLFVNYVILGHSERRAIFGETDETINAKVKAALDNKLKPILCFGETIEEREAGKLEEVLRTQISGGLAGVEADQMNDIVLAYEPVWAIGTGHTASPQQAQDAHAFCRSVIADLYDDEVASKIRIQYGGSVKPDNMGELISQEDIDGALVGGASLQEGSFYGIVEAAAKYVGER